MKQQSGSNQQAMMNNKMNVLQEQFAPLMQYQNQLLTGNNLSNQLNMLSGNMTL